MGAEDGAGAVEAAGEQAGMVLAGDGVAGGSRLSQARGAGLAVGGRDGDEGAGAAPGCFAGGTVEGEAIGHLFPGFPVPATARRALRVDEQVADFAAVACAGVQAAVDDDPAADAVQNGVR
jgi:hypothetical protein